MSTQKGGNKFNNIDFNPSFEQARNIAMAKIREEDKQKLAKLDKTIIQKPITDLSVGEILIGIKNSWFDLIDDLLQRRFTMSTFTKNNRLFYIGVTIVIFIIIIYLYDVYTTHISEKSVKETVKIYHLYKDNHNPITKKGHLDELTKSVIAFAGIPNDSG